jgi:arylsulfatase A-like enzyme
MALRLGLRRENSLGVAVLRLIRALVWLLPVAIALAGFVGLGLGAVQAIAPGVDWRMHALAAAAIGIAATCVGGAAWHARRIGLTTLAAAGAIPLVVLAALPGPGFEGRLQPIDGAGLPPVSAPGAPDAERPNLVLVVLDTVRAANLSSYGYSRDTSPFLDSLASQGVLYEHAISPAPWTLPAHASLFTGLAPSVHRATGEHKRLDDEYVTVAEALRAGGYESVAAVSNGSAAAAHNLHQGFERFYEVFRLRRERYRSPLEQAFPGPLKGPFRTLIGSGPMDKGAAYVNRIVAGWLEGRAARGDERPFFLFVNYLEAHLPYDPPEPFRRRYERSPPPDSLANLLGPDWYHALFRRIGRGQPLTEAERRALTDRYDAEIAYQDERLEELVDLLDSHEGAQELAIVVTSDHGENLGEHGLLDHVFSVHETVLHVPLIVRHPPAFASGTRIPESVSTASVPATLLDLAGLPALPHELGASPLPRRPGGTTAPLVFSEEHLRLHEIASVVSETPGVDASAWSHRYRVVQDGRWKVVRTGESDLAVFDLQQDPDELRPLPLSERPAARSLVERLERWERMADGASTGSGGGIGELDPELRESLRALGYLR